MSGGQQIEDLLLEWEDHWQQGRSVTAKELCSQRPDLIDDLQKKIDALRQVYSALDFSTATGQETVSIRASEDLPQPEGFECVEYLGQGGASVVYKAWQAKLARYVALKFIRDRGLASPQLLERFRAESKAAALQHPNIAQIFDVGEYRGSPFIALEFVDGGTLGEHVRGNPQTPRDAATLVWELASAVEYAHQRGVVHRDLKPANILLKSKGPVTGNDDASAEHNAGDVHWPDMIPKISDFGIARFLDQPSHVTITGDVMGTPAYMAPEQAEGRTAEIGPPTDVHALGTILYELLTGRPPFACPTHMETLNQLRNREPIAPSQIQSGIPADLENICLRCLQKEPHQRYKTSEELVGDLDCFLKGMPVTARPISPAKRVARWCRRNPAVASLACSLVVAIVAGFALVTWKWIEADRARRVADANFAQIRSAVDDYLVIVSEDVLLNEPAMQPLRDRLLTTAVDYYEDFLEDHDGDSGLEAELNKVRAKVGRIKWLLGDRVESQSLLKRALASQRGLLHQNPNRFEHAAALQDIENVIAGTLIESGDLNEAEKVLSQAVKRNEYVLGKSRLPIEQRVAAATSYDLLGVVQDRRGQTELATKSHQSAIDTARRLLEESVTDQTIERQLASSLSRIGSLQMDLGDHSAAQTALQEAVAIYRNLVRRSPKTIHFRSGLANSLETLGRLWTRQRDWAAAVESFEKAGTIQRQLIKENPQVISFRMKLWSQLMNFAVALRDQNLERALSFQREALTLGLELTETNPQFVGARDNLALTYNNLGAYYSDLGLVQDAVASYEHAVDHLVSLVDDYPGNVSYRARLVLSCANLGVWRGRLGEDNKAIDVLKTGIEHGRQLVKDSPNVTTHPHRLADALQSLGQTHCKTGDTATGLPLLRESIQILEKIADGQDTATTSFKNDLAHSYLIYCSYAMDTQKSDELNRYLERGRRLVDELTDQYEDDAHFQLTLAKSLFSAGHVEQNKGRANSAIENYEQALGIAESLVDKHPQVLRYKEWLARICNNLGNAFHSSRQSEKAKPLFDRAIELLESINAQLAVTQTRQNALAQAHLNLGNVQKDGGQLRQAITSTEKAIEIWKSLLQDSEMTRARIGLAAGYGNLGHIQWPTQPTVALNQYNLGIEHVQTVLGRQPKHITARRFKQNLHWGRARAFNKLKRYREASDDWQEVLSLTPQKSKRLFQMELAWSQAKAGDHRSAVELADALAAENADQAAILFNCARLFSLSVGALEKSSVDHGEGTAKLSDQYESGCFELLKKVENLGYFRQPGRVEQLKSNADFQPVRSRSRFKNFIESLQGDI